MKELHVPGVDDIRSGYEADAALREQLDAALARAERAEAEVDVLAHVLRQMRDSRATSFVAYQNDARDALYRADHFLESTKMVAPEAWTGVGMKPGPVTVNLASTDAATSESNRETTSASGGDAEPVDDEERDDDVCECGHYRGDHLDGLCWPVEEDGIPIGFQRRLPTVRPCDRPECAAAAAEAARLRALIVEWVEADEPIVFGMGTPEEHDRFDAAVAALLAAAKEKPRV